MHLLEVLFYVNLKTPCSSFRVMRMITANFQVSKFRGITVGFSIEDEPPRQNTCLRGVWGGGFRPATEDS